MRQERHHRVLHPRTQALRQADTVGERFFAVPKQEIVQVGVCAGQDRVPRGRGKLNLVHQRIERNGAAEEGLDLAGSRVAWMAQGQVDWR